MPLYEYECDACGHRFEVIQKSADSPSGTCPKCGGAVHKLQSAPAFQFKGSGWYVTDYARKDQSAGKTEKSDKSEKSASGEGSKSEGGKTDSSKSEAKESTAKSDTPKTDSSPKT
jgi:putative FmdB family regulatory protein